MRKRCSPPRLIAWTPPTRRPRHNHNPIELHAATLAWDGESAIHPRRVAVRWTHVAWSIAEVFGIEEGNVRVTSPYVGGGFGSKTLWQHHILAAAAAETRLSGRCASWFREKASSALSAAAR